MPPVLDCINGQVPKLRLYVRFTNK